jgi:hypothetical protein
VGTGDVAKAVSLGFPGAVVTEAPVVGVGDQVDVGHAQSIRYVRWVA